MNELIPGGLGQCLVVANCCSLLPQGRVMGKKSGEGGIESWVNEPCFLVRFKHLDNFRYGHSLQKWIKSIFNFICISSCRNLIIRKQIFPHSTLKNGVISPF